MAKERKGKVAEQAARLKALEELKNENTCLICLVKTDKFSRECSRCPRIPCQDHFKFIGGRVLCEKCFKIEILFGDISRA